MSAASMGPLRNPYGPKTPEGDKHFRLDADPMTSPNTPVDVEAVKASSSSSAERAALLAPQANCPDAPSFAGHAPSCPVSKAAACAVGIECEHGFDVCGICDRCTCGPFQARVLPWMLECFGPDIPFDKEERGDRVLEEVFELLQSGGYDQARVAALRDYVWGRPAGEPSQEVGGVMVTLAAYCIAHKLDMAEAGETELARIWTKVPQIRAKQAAKPTGSALPIALSSEAQTPVCEQREQAAPSTDELTLSRLLAERREMLEALKSIAGQWDPNKNGRRPPRDIARDALTKAAIASSEGKGE